MVWTPSQRPRRPRFKASHHFVLPVEKSLRWFQQPSRQLSARQAADVARLVPGTISKDLLESFIIAASRNFFDSRNAAEPQKPFVRYQLRLLAHLAWQALERPYRRADVFFEIFGILREMHFRTKGRLFEAIAFRDPEGMAPDIRLYGPHPARQKAEIIINAVMTMEDQGAGRGDYADAALHEAVRFLVFLFEWWSCETPPKLGKVAYGVTTSGGACSQIGDGALAEFVYAFFGLVDARLTKPRITWAIDRRLREVRRNMRRGEKDIHDLANLFTPFARYG